MEFLEVVRKGEFVACAYFIDGRRVSKDTYQHREIIVEMYGVFDCLHTTSTKSTWQFRKCGRMR